MAGTASSHACSAPLLPPISSDPVWARWAYPYDEIKQRWQACWEEHRMFRTPDASRPKDYILGMFPYPSGSGEAYLCNSLHPHVFSVALKFAHGSEIASSMTPRSRRRQQRWRQQSSVPNSASITGLSSLDGQLLPPHIEISTPFLLMDSLTDLYVRGCRVQRNNLELENIKDKIKEVLALLATLLREMMLERSPSYRSAHKRKFLGMQDSMVKLVDVM
ncbi:hypothetical protein TRIUR3_28722 [Triticum urartu]|uniref:Uncharacterized protein n=1 Tax=Triticum urartu TaxID=4572 RepID=M7ZNW7_TRIUA|nr:hypothetical protein TRIUR3_28722 [Triticum urartu]